MCKLASLVTCANYPILVANDDEKCCHDWMKMYPVFVFQNKQGNAMMFRQKNWMLDFLRY